MNNGYLRRCREGHVRLLGSLYLERRSAPCLLADCMQASLQESTDPSNSIRSRPLREVHEGPTDELGEVLSEPARTRL
jgi:hypothetical protein